MLRVRRPHRLVVLAVIAILALTGAVPLAWHASIERRADRIDAMVERRRAAHVALDAEAHDGERDCNTRDELARLVPDRPRHDRSRELDRAVEQSLECRVAWSARPGAAGWVEDGSVGISVLDAYLRGIESESADECIDRAINGVRLMVRLSAGVPPRADSIGEVVERVIECADRASPEARAAAFAAISPLALEPPPAWFAIEPAALTTARRYAEDVRALSGLSGLVSLALHPEFVRGTLQQEGRAYDALGVAEESRRCDDACLVGLSRKGFAYPTAFMSAGASRPLFDDIVALIGSRAYLRAAVVALDESRAADPRLSSPWDGTPMRVIRGADGLAVEWNEAGGVAAVPVREQR